MAGRSSPFEYSFNNSTHHRILLTKQNYIQASFHLINFISNNSHLFKNKKILELGAGTGLVGFAANLLLYPTTHSPPCNDDTTTSNTHLEPWYTFSDHHHDVIKLLNSNIQLNLASASESGAGWGVVFLGRWMSG